MNKVTKYLCFIKIATVTPYRVAAAFLFYMPMQLVAPSAVTIAVATDAIICTINLMVSFLVMILMFLSYTYGFHGLYGLLSPLVISTKRSAWSARLCRLASPRNLLNLRRRYLGEVESFGLV